MVYSADPRTNPGDTSSRLRRPGCRSPAPAAASGTSPRRTWCWRTPPVDLPTVFGANSPEVAQYNADPDSFKDPGERRLHGRRRALREGRPRSARKASAVKYGQTSPTPSAVSDRLPTEPGGYTRLPGAVRRALRRAADRRWHAERHRGTAYPVTNANGDLPTSTATDHQQLRPTTSPASPGSARPLRSRLPTSLTCRRPGFR